MKNKYIFLIGGPLVLMGIWILITELNLISPLFLASPVSIFLKTFELLVKGEIMSHILSTLLRLFLGLVTAIIISIPLGLIMGYYDKVYYSLEIFIDFFRSIPATALFPLFILFFGIGNLSKIAVITWSCSFILLINTMYGVRYSKKLRIKAASLMKISKLDLFRKIILLDALPHVFSGLRIAISIGLIIAVVTEMFVGSNLGLGKLIVDSQYLYKIPEMYVGIFVTGLLGYIFNKIIILIQKKVIYWEQ